MANKPKLGRRLSGGIGILLLLALCLCISSVALFYAGVSVKDNLFRTGNVSLNLNDGKAVIQEHEFLFEPGMTVEKQFFVRNDSSCEVYYKLYFDNIEGGLADVLVITISCGDKTLYSGTASELSKEQCAAADDVLRLREYREFTIVFHYPENAGNRTQNLALSFDLCAQAVQTNNNPDKEFE